MRRLAVVALVMLALPALTANAQRAATGRSEPGSLKRLFTVDSAQLREPTVSPSGRWIAFTRVNSDDGTASIWMAAMADPKPFRITSAGYTDGWPSISPTGDKLFFVSNRPSRDAHSTAMYVMSVPIDKSTGQPTGPVRQVTTDSIAGATVVSPDGKWLAYSAFGDPIPLRLVPSSGGNARTLASKANGAQMIPLMRATNARLVATFSADSRYVVFQDSGAKLVRKVEVSGGPVTTLAAVNEGIVTVLPGHDDSYLFVPTSSTLNNALPEFEMEKRDLGGRVLGVIRVPNHYVSGYGASSQTRVDGRGRIGAKYEPNFGLKRISLSTGAIVDALSGKQDWPFGVASDGSIVTSRTVDARVVLSTSTSSGKLVRELTLPPEVKQVVGLLRGGAKILAWGSAYPHTPIVNERGQDKVTKRVPAYLVDRANGAARLLADSVMSMSLVHGTCCPRNWGADEDVSGIAEVRGSTVDVKSIDANGATRLVHSFPVAIYERFSDVSIHGTRLAYADSIAKGETAIFVTTGPSTPPVRIGVMIGDSTDVAIAWSPDGRRLAAAYADGTKNGRPTAYVFEVAADGSAVGTSTALDLGGTTRYFENIEWLPDGSALLVMAGYLSRNEDKTCWVRHSRASAAS
jgi:Tol biopolymer transport system component